MFLRPFRSSTTKQLTKRWDLAKLGLLFAGTPFGQHRPVGVYVCIVCIRSYMGLVKMLVKEIGIPKSPLERPIEGDFFEDA